MAPQPRSSSRPNARALLRLAAALILTAGAPLAVADGPASEDSAPVLRTRSLEIPVETVSAGAAPIEGLTLWVTRDAGMTWTPTPGVHPGGSPIHFEATDDGEYGFRIVARDAVGRAQPVPQPGEPAEISCVIDTTPPQLAVLSPHSGDRIYAGSRVIIRWEASDRALGETPVSIEARRSSEDPWSPIDPDTHHEAAGAIQWWPPFAAGAFQLRVTAEDAAGNRRSWTPTRPLEIVPFDGFPEFEVMAAETTTNFREFPIFYRSPVLDPSGVVAAEIWVRRGGGAWQRRLDPDRRSPYTFRAEQEGEFELYLRCVDRSGRGDRAEPGPDTPPDLRVVVDTLPPVVALQIEDGSPQRVHRGGMPLQLHWTIEESDPHPRGARIEASIDAGRRWQVIEEIGEVALGGGTLEWTPPIIETEDLRLRIIVEDRAGNRAVRAAPTLLRIVDPLSDPSVAAAVHHERALILAARGDERSLLRALDELSLVTGIAPESASAWHDRGVLLTRLSRHGEATEAYVRALELRVGDPRLAFSVVQGHLNEALTRPEGAEGALERARAALAIISRASLYEDPDFRALLARHTALREALEPPPVDPLRMP